MFSHFFIKIEESILYWINKLNILIIKIKSKILIYICIYYNIRILIDSNKVALFFFNIFDFWFGFIKVYVYFY